MNPNGRKGARAAGRRCRSLRAPVQQQQRTPANPAPTLLRPLTAFCTTSTEWNTRRSRPPVRPVEAPPPEKGLEAPDRPSAGTYHESGLENRLADARSHLIIQMEMSVLSTCVCVMEKTDNGRPIDTYYICLLCTALSDSQSNEKPLFIPIWTLYKSNWTLFKNR